MHPSDGPGQSLDQEMLHDALLKETCHVERDGMWARSRMEPRFWERVRTSTPWARDLDFQTIRTLALGLTQAAWAHFKNPKFDRKVKRRPCCKLAVASLRFSSDIGTYEDHLNQERPVDINFSQFRAPIYHNGKPLKGRHLSKKQRTIPVFPPHVTRSRRSRVKRVTSAKCMAGPRASPGSLRDWPVSKTAGSNVDT